jgi:hypothetical protein
MTLGVFALLFVASSIEVNSYSFASTSASTQQQSLDLTILNGGITDAGPQQWAMSGGALVAAYDNSTTVLANSTWNHVYYSMIANIIGLSAKGTFYLHLAGTTADGRKIDLRFHTIIDGSIPAVCFPSYSVTGMCESGDTSEIPAYFVANGFARVALGSTLSPRNNVSLIVEDAALNPFGGPIVISSSDGSLVVVATYRNAITLWDGVHTAGTLSGTVGQTSASGAFTQTIHTEEDYVAGTAQDYGQVSMVGMTPSWLDSRGVFYGTSIIPKSGTIDCSPPGLPGTCTETGYDSMGAFTLDPNGVQISGRYSVVWPAPSIMFGGNLTAKL